MRKGITHEEFRKIANTQTNTTWQKMISDAKKRLAKEKL